MDVPLDGRQLHGSDGWRRRSVWSDDNHLKRLMRRKELLTDSSQGGKR